jgi:hypothetical protein
LIIVMLAALGTLLAAPTPATAADGPTVLFRFQDERIAESSGLAASALHDGIVWTLNDSGDEARIFAVDRRGRTKAVYRIEGLSPRDWEAIAPGRDAKGRPALFIGDIGDNSNSRDRGILVHVVTEPRRLTGGTLRPESYRIRYPDRPMDAETLLVDPRTNRLRIVTKGFLGGGIYEAPEHLDAARPNILKRLGNAPSLVTDGTYLPDGRYVLRDYYQAFLYGPDGSSLGEIALPRQDQGEAIAVTWDSSALLAGSEGVGSEVWRVPLTVAPSTPAGTPGSSAAETPEPASSVGEAGGLENLVSYAWAGGALFVLIAIAGGWLVLRVMRR